MTTDSNKDSVYLDRWKIVRSLGFVDYRDYLQSEMWAKIRARVLKKAGRKCSMCDNRANQVHHIKYTRENMSGKSLSHLIASCEECHELIHLDDGSFVAQKESKSRVDLFVKTKKVQLKHKSLNKVFGLDARCKKCKSIVWVSCVKQIKRARCKCGCGVERIR